MRSMSKAKMLQSMMKTKQNNDITNLWVWSTSKPKLNYQDLFDQVRSMMKTRQDNNMIDHTGAVYIEYDTELS